MDGKVMISLKKSRLFCKLCRTALKYRCCTYLCVHLVRQHVETCADHADASKT